MTGAPLSSPVSPKEVWSRLENFYSRRKMLKGYQTSLLSEISSNKKNFQLQNEILEREMVEYEQMLREIDIKYCDLTIELYKRLHLKVDEDNLDVIGRIRVNESDMCVLKAENEEINLKQEYLLAIADQLRKIQEIKGIVRVTEVYLGLNQKSKYFDQKLEEIKQTRTKTLKTLDKWKRKREKNKYIQTQIEEIERDLTKIKKRIFYRDFSIEEEAICANKNDISVNSENQRLIEIRKQILEEELRISSAKYSLDHQVATTREPVLVDTSSDEILAGRLFYTTEFETERWKSAVSTHSMNVMLDSWSRRLSEFESLVMDRLK